MNLKELYQELILEHGKNPRNLGKTENFNKDAKGNNPLCGDNVHIYLKLNDQRKVEDISFEGSGCAISMASASIMTDLIKGKSDNEAKEIIEDFLGMIKENPELKTKLLKKVSVPDDQIVELVNKKYLELPAALKYEIETSGITKKELQ